MLEVESRILYNFGLKMLDLVVRICAVNPLIPRKAERERTSISELARLRFPAVLPSEQTSMQICHSLSKRPSKDEFRKMFMIFLSSLLNPPTLYSVIHPLVVDVWCVLFWDHAH